MPEPDHGQPARGPAIIRTGEPVGSTTERAGEALARLVHDLRNLIDGSHRQVNLALRSVKDAAGLHTEQEDLLRRLRTVRTALEQMAILAAEASGRPEAARAATASARRTMADAVRHAAWILEPRAAKHGIRISVELADAFEHTPAGAVYTVVLNGVQNAIEAIRATGRTSGVVRITGAFHEVAWARRLCLEITDDGVGVKPGLQCFDHGVTSKRGHLGIGLSMAAEVVAEADGMISLEPRADAPGATLRVLLPLPRQSTEETPS